MSEKLLLVDGMYVIFSSFYSNPRMRTLGGMPTGAIYGFVTRTENLIRDLQPDRIAVTFDSKEKTFRHKAFPQYKAKREQPPEELIQQLPFIREYLQTRGIPFFELPGLEADDIMAAIAQEWVLSGNQVIIFTADKDLFQLVNDSVLIFHPRLKQVLGRGEIKALFGIFPEQVVDYLSLVGDTSDNIPGVPGIGDKTAIQLIQQFGSLQQMLENIEALPQKVREKIEQNRKLLEISKRLVDLNQAPEIKKKIKVDRFQNRTQDSLIDLYRKLSFNTLLKKLNFKERKASRLDISHTVVKNEEQLKRLRERIKSHKRFAFDIETTDISFYKSQIVGVSFVFDKEGYYIPFLYPEKDDRSLTVSREDFFSQMREVFEDPSIRKVGHNLKFDVLNLKQNGINVKGIEDDTMVMSYLIFPNRRSHRLKELSQEFLEYRQTSFDEITKRGKRQVCISEVPLSEVASYCIDDAAVSMKLAGILSKQIKDKNLAPLYRRIEIPLVEVLIDMEAQGVKVDRDFLKKAEKILEHKTNQIADEIYDIAGYKFNLNSSQQLGALLFEKMQLPITKRTQKTRAYSTDIDVLKELKPYPVVEKIIDYRLYKKLLSTYICGIIETIDPHGRVHSSFNQTVTATGRLSSSNPNLQNIPVGEMGGVNVRKAFIAEKNDLLLAADYSQIELRVMAHFSKDPGLIRAFEQGDDIHRHTAEQVFGPDSDLSANEKRKRAKIINFSILYGSGPFSLSKELGVSYQEAQTFIDLYFKKYNGVKEFIDKVIVDAEKHPEVKTISGRKREIPEILSANRNVKENGKRMAINTIIQGSAADIIKIAMIGIHRQLKGMKSRMIMQVHDELVFEYPKKEEKQLFQLVKREMEKAVDLRVPIKVTLKKGVNWAEMSEV